MRDAHPFSSDTSPEVQRLLVERWRAMKPWEKAALVAVLCRDCEILAIAGIRDREPDAGPEEIRRRLAVLRLGRELATQALGPDASDAEP